MPPTTGSTKQSNTRVPSFVSLLKRSLPVRGIVLASLDNEYQFRNCLTGAGTRMQQGPDQGRTRNDTL